MSKFADVVPYERFLDCVHCGLCVSSCPTFVVLGNEADSPRGRIYLMKALADGRLAFNEEVSTHLWRCLDCRACESACPSGVQYSKLIESFRVKIPKPNNKLLRWSLLNVFPYTNRVRTALAPLRLAERILGRERLQSWSEFLPRSLRAMYRALPEERAAIQLPKKFLARGQRRATVALLTGCVADVFFQHVHLATARVLQANGCDVLIPREQGCCGALQHHIGEEAHAVQSAQRLLDQIELSSVDAIISNVAGCGSMLKEYHHLPLPMSYKEKALSFSQKIRDASEFLIELGPRPPRYELPLRAVYHDACHLVHAQKISKEPRRLLSLIPGLTLVPLKESEMCCGAAGSYNLSQPEIAEELGERKASYLAETGAELVLTGNAGCLLQIERHAKKRAKVWHTMEALDYAYRGE